MLCLRREVLVPEQRLHLRLLRTLLPQHRPLQSKDVATPRAPAQKNLQKMRHLPQNLRPPAQRLVVSPWPSIPTASVDITLMNSRMLILIGFLYDVVFSGSCAGTEFVLYSRSCCKDVTLSLSESTGEVIFLEKETGQGMKEAGVGCQRLRSLTLGLVEQQSVCCHGFCCCHLCKVFDLPSSPSSSPLSPQPRNWRVSAWAT